ncbi:MAG: DUF3237 domain-containing protein [Thermosynechococcaceae cyanobacterium]
MQFTSQGLTLWYGTPDAPAPQETMAAHDEMCVCVGVAPSSLSHTVSIRYRIDGGMERMFYAPLWHTDHGTGKQYFKGCFPRLPPGALVEYGVFCQSAGRQVPSPDQVVSLPASFKVAGLQQAVANTAAIQPQESRLPFAMDYLCRFTIYLSQEPEIIGETPEGINVNWYPIGGEFVGNRLNGTLRAEGGDWMTIRRDGIGILGVRATLVTTDGALIYASYSGVFELGENGYANFLKRKWPARPTTRHTPRFLTAHPQYLWLNRLQCMGIGEVRMQELVYVYDLYALH